METADRTIGHAIADLVIHEFEDLIPAGKIPGIRIVGFPDAEVRFIVERLLERDLRLPGHEDSVRIVVGTSTAPPGIPAEVILAPGLTMTHHRNHNDHGLVMIDLDPQGDETGIRAMHTLSDSDLLNHPDLGVVRRRIRHIAAIDWNVADPTNVLDAPESLLETLESIFEGLIHAHRPSLRSWIGYTVAVNRRLLELRRAVTGSEVQEIAASELPSLNLFSDLDLFDRQGAVERHLAKNANMAELQTPQGRNLNEDDLISSIDRVRFRDETGTDLSTSENELIRRQMRAIVASGGPGPSGSIEMRLWEQLFEKKGGPGLSSQIRSYLESSQSDRLAEFDDLALDSGLEDGEEDAARALLEAEPLDGEVPLVDLLPTAVRNKLNRLVFQGERIEQDPLIAVLYGLNAFDGGGESDTIQTIRLEWDPTTVIASRSARLFAFLYRPTLSDIAASCDGTVGAKFELDDQLVKIPSIEDLFGDEFDPENDDADDEHQRSWGPMRFKLLLSGTSTPLIRFRWDPRQVPGLAAFARLVRSGGAPDPIEMSTLDKWCDQAFEPTPLEESAYSEEQGDELLNAWSVLSVEHFPKWVRMGIDVSALDEFLDEWMPILERARQEFVPAGGALKVLDNFLERETGRTESGHLVMLGTHPFRLRWLRHHLANLGAFIRQSLMGDLTLNPENDRLFFDWIERASPHLQPPVMSGGKLMLAKAVREMQLHEEYATVRSNEGAPPEWLGSLDEASIEELVAVSKSFVTAFPQKLGGLSVLLMANSGAAGIARRYVTRLRHGDFANLDLELHVVTSSAEHDEIAAALSELDTDDDRGRSLLPRFRLLLHDWEDEIPRALEDLKGRIDLALAPNLFGLHSNAFDETRKDSHTGGRFDPWLDTATHTRPAAQGAINVSEVLLPEMPDQPLEDWSTLTVRRYRQAPVSPDDPSGTDFVTLQVAFDKNEELFEKLHEVSNWVVTLDPFVGRDQIDALENAPDVIVVKPDIGKNESYTLVVSSTAGQAWVTQRLRQRLIDDFDVDDVRATELAHRLYEIGRHAVPSLMLRAVGLGRTTEEILGLILARYAVGGSPEVGSQESGMEYWLSLDEHADWFGSASRLRPDLLRVRLSATDSGTKLDLLVLESKFRQTFDTGIAEQQVDRGVRLFDSAFGGPSNGGSDARFWRRELTSALSQLSHRRVRSVDLPTVAWIGNDVNEQLLIDDLRTGNYEFGTTSGVICATAWAGESLPESASYDVLKGHRLIALGRREGLELLGQIERESAPDERAAEGVSSVQTAAPADAPSTDGELRPVPVPSLLGQDAEVDASPIVSGEQRDSMLSTEGSRGLSTDQLELRYSKILDVLHNLGIEIDRPTTLPFREGPGFFRFRVVPKPGVSADRIMSKVDDIKLVLGLPAELNIRSYVDKGAVVFEAPKEDADRYYVTAQSIWEHSTDTDDVLSVPIGEDIEGNVVPIDFSSSDTPHLLIAGQTGSGKTIALETILTGLCRSKTASELQLLLVDPKSTELVEFTDDPHLRGEIGWLPDQAIEILTEAVEEMNARYERFRDMRKRSLPEYNAAVQATSRIPWWVIVLDEYADLTADADDRKAIEALLKRIAQKGRASGIHLIVATQKPSAEVISTVIRSNLPAQLALRVKSSTDSRIILEEAGAESLAGKGDAFLRTARGLIRVQCAMVTH
jgi:S-DNA-T family DNA segregation ATPase FtsK/SpoIIIE